MQSLYEVEERSILGVRIQAFRGCGGAAEYIRGRIAEGRKTFCVAMNPEKVYRARRDAALKRVLEGAHARICDGVGLALASRILLGKRLERCTGVDLFFAMAGMAEAEGWSVFLLGASAESNRRARAALRRMLPRLRIAGARDGFFRDSAEVVEEINRSGAQLLFAAMGSPRQEFWIHERLERLNPLLCMGIGGSLDVLAGCARRAPAVFRKTGTEWLFRLVSDPKRARRQMALPLFAWEVLKEAVARG